MVTLPGKKKLGLYRELLRPHFPTDWSDLTYVEPFGGTYAVRSYLTETPQLSVYNDVVRYTFDEILLADIVEQLDYQAVIKKYDGPNTFFYLDPPYVEKEDLYGLKKNDIDFHIKLRNVVLKLQGQFVISYEENSLILELYSGPQFKIVKYAGQNYPYRKEMIILRA